MFRLCNGASSLRRVLCRSLWLSFVVPAAVTAQQEREGGVLEEVTVTAQRRAESMQSVPIAVSAFTQADLVSAGVTSTGDLPAIAPSMVWVTGRNAANAYLRGVGTTSLSPANEAPVAMYVDGVYLPAMNAATLSLSNIERIEVLRGPQGTLFGRNATGGLVHIITRTPSHDTSGEVELGYANFQTVTGRAYATSGFGDTLAGDLAVFYSDQGEGWGRNLTTGDEVNLARDVALRSKWLLELGATTSLTFAADYADHESDIGSTRTVLDGALGIDGLPPPGSMYDTGSELPPIGDSQQWGVNLRADHEMRFGRFVSLTAYREEDAEYSFDQDGTPVPLVQAFASQPSDTLTQEFQLISADDSPIQWIGGAFYMDRIADFAPLTLAGDAFGGLTLNRTNRVTIESLAVFGQATFDVTDKTDLTLGLRHTWDDLTFHALQTRADTGAVLRDFRDDASFSELTWRVALDYEFTDSAIGYLSYNRGFKSGVFNHTSSGGPAIAPEILDSFEVGIKSDLFDERLRVNTAAYYYDYADLQVEVLEVGGAGQTNAPSAEIYGVEIEATLVASDALSLSASVSVSGSQYEDFSSAPVTVPLPEGANEEFPGDVSGNSLVNLPDWTLNLGLDYTVSLAASELGFNLSYYHNAGFFWDYAERVPQDAYDLVNASVAWTAGGGAWTLRLWGRNLLDEEYSPDLSVSSLGDVIAPAAPRTYGASLAYKF